MDMADEWTTPLTVEQMYGDWGVEWDDAMALTDRSLDPRPRTSIYDTLFELGLGHEDVVLDIGGRDATDGLAIAERFGCRVIVVDRVQLNLDDALHAVAGHDHGHLVEAHQGTINQIPVDDDAVDVVFSRGMMGHVEDLDGALIECRRVLNASGSMLIHDVFETSLLEPAEKERFCADLAMVPDRLSIERVSRSKRQTVSDPSGSNPFSSETTARTDFCAPPACNAQSTTLLPRWAWFPSASCRRTTSGPSTGCSASLRSGCIRSPSMAPSGYT